MYTKLSLLVRVTVTTVTNLSPVSHVINFCVIDFKAVILVAAQILLTFFTLHRSFSPFEWIVFVIHPRVCLVVVSVSRSADNTAVVLTHPSDGPVVHSVQTRVFVGGIVAWPPSGRFFCVRIAG